MPPKRRYEGYVARNLLDSHTYPSGTPPPTTEQLLELTKIEASTLASRMKNIPVHFEHQDNLSSVGKVVDSWIDGTDLKAEFELDDDGSNGSAALVAPLLDNFKLNCLSLTHLPDMMLPIELSIVEKGARPGTVIVNRPGLEEQLSKMKISASASNSMLKSTVYKTVFTGDSVIRASNRNINSMSSSIVINNPALSHLITNPATQAELDKLTLPPNGFHPFSSPAEEKKKAEDKEQAKKVEEHEMKFKQMADELSTYKQIISSIMPPNMQTPQINGPQPTFHQQLINQQQQQQFQQPNIPVHASNNFNNNNNNNQQQPPVNNNQQWQQPPVNNNNNQQFQQQFNNNNNNNNNMELDFNQQLLKAAESLTKPNNRINSDQEKATVINAISQAVVKQKQSDIELDKLRKELEEKTKKLEEKELENANTVSTFSAILDTNLPHADPETLKQLKEAALSKNQQQFQDSAMKITASSAKMNQQFADQLKVWQQWQTQQAQQQQAQQQQSLAQMEYNNLQNMMSSNSGFNNNYSSSNPAPISASSQNYDYNNNNNSNNNLQQFDSHTLNVIRASEKLYQRQNQNGGRTNTISTDEAWKRMPCEPNSICSKTLNAPNVGMENSDKFNLKLVADGAKALNPYGQQFSLHHDFHYSQFQG